jgi:hypothetical protein
MGNINFTVSLDGVVSPKPVQVDFQPDGSPVRYNVSLFDLQSLPSSHHILIINSSANVQFDYALVTA